MDLKTVKALCVTGLLCLKMAAAWAQPHRFLTPADFRGTPRANSRGVVAYTNCTINFSYQATRMDNYYRVHANVSLTMNRDRSWMDMSRITSQAQLTEILKHEQGHYTIAYLEQQEVLRAIQRTRFTANYRYEAMELFNRIDAKYKQLNIDYDEDTEHSVNKQQQHSWDIYFAKRLQYMPQETASL
jgi:predicted secreted Zn-dependent protease